MSTKNYRMLIQYDGTNYAGWQIQKNALTVQQVIKDKLEILLKIEINLIGSGRTDTGVHALGQVANFKTETEIDLNKFAYSLNAMLPNDISIIDIEEACEDFNARFDAKSRSYLYFISPIKSPFYFKYSYFFRENVNWKKLNEISKVLAGKHDFTSFSKTGTETKTNICNINSLHFNESKNFILFFIEADRFLHGMVRAILGTLLRTAKQGYDTDSLKEILEAKDRTAAGMAVPAKGLFLYKVKY